MNVRAVCLAVGVATPVTSQAVLLHRKICMFLFASYTCWRICWTLGLLPDFWFDSDKIVHNKC